MGDVTPVLRHCPLHSKCMGVCREPELGLCDARAMAGWIKANVARASIDPPPAVTQAAARVLDAE